MTSEANIHMALWKLIEAYQLPDTKIFHVPNGEKRGPKTASRLRAMGVIPGVPDFGYIANGKAGFLELKAEGGRLSPNQREFFRVAEHNRIPCSTVYSVADAAWVLQLVGVLDPAIKFTQGSTAPA